MENDKCSVQFKYKCEGTIYENVGIVGSIDNLKNWNINEPVFLSYNIKDKLFISEQLELLKNKLIEYKYVFIDEVTLAEDFIEGAALLSDIFVITGIADKA